MLALRATLIPLAAPAGLILALGLWLVFGRHPQSLDDIAGLDARLAAARPVVAGRSMALDALAARALATPVFALTTGPGAVADIPVTLSGIALTRTRRAVLVSIGGKPADWLALGATRDGVTLMAVTGAGATVDTPTGFKTLSFSDNTAGGGPVSPAVK